MRSPEASRAKHKFAVKRNSWPKTRGVAMNPVDHVRLPCITQHFKMKLISLFYSLTEVVIINILVKLRQFHGMRLKVKKQVLLQLGELVYFVVRRRRRISRISGVLGLAIQTVVCLAQRSNTIPVLPMSSNNTCQCDSVPC